MKTRNCKSGILVIFLALCFTIYAGNCYPQLWTSQEPGLSFYDSWPSQISEWPSRISEWPSRISEWPSRISNPWIDYGWPLSGFFFYEPAGKTTLEFFQDIIPDLTYERFYNMEDYSYSIDNLYDDFYTYERFYNMEDYSYSIDNLYDDYYGFPGPIMDEWNLYKRTDLYYRPKAGEQTLYNFTKNFLVQPRKPDIYTGYGMGGLSSMGGFGGMSIMAGMGILGGMSGSGSL